MARLHVLCVAAALAAGCGSKAAATDGPVADDAPAQTDSSGGTDLGRTDSSTDGLLPDGASHDAAPDGTAADAKLDGTASCQWSAPDPCGADWYCAAPGCGGGSCTAIPETETNGRSPVCGCDGLTYWNSSVAARHGMAVKATGVCSTASLCGGIGSIACPNGALCSYNVGDAEGCKISDAAGTCWVLPEICPTIMIGPTTRQCEAVTCTGECQLIKTGARWYDDNTCPV